jgi:hypothetical protein
MRTDLSLAPVYRLLNPLGFAAGQLAVFQGASDVPLSEPYWSSEQRRKTANWPRPEGLRRKWVGCFVARQSSIDPDMFL